MDHRRMEALAIVWNHWTRDEIQARKALVWNRSVRATERMILHRLHMENYFLYLEGWRHGHPFRDRLQIEARWLIENNSLQGLCEDCDNGLMRCCPDEYDGFMIHCHSCGAVGHVFIGLFAE